MLNGSFSFSWIYCDADTKEGVKGEDLIDGGEGEAGNAPLQIRPITALVVTDAVTRSHAFLGGERQLKAKVQHRSINRPILCRGGCEITRVRLSVYLSAGLI